MAAVLLALVLLAGTALAALPDRLIPGGQAIGLQLQTDGVSIVELAQDNPCAREAGLRRGDRSEERRVGKECRSRWSPYH